MCTVNRFSAAIHFAVYVVAAEAAFHGDWNVGRDTAVAGVQSSTSAARSAGILSVTLPSELRTSQGSRSCDPGRASTSTRPSLVRSSRTSNRPETRTEPSLVWARRLPSTSSSSSLPSPVVKSNSPLRPFAETCAVAGVDIDLCAPWHADLQFGAAVVDPDGEMGVMRLPQLDVDRVSLLMFHDFQSAASYVPAAGGHARLNLVLIPASMRTLASWVRRATRACRSGRRFSTNRRRERKL